MQCQRCNKQPATIHLTEILNNQKTERHLCEDCAKEEGIAVKAQINLQDVLAGMLAAHDTAERYANLKCPDCGLTYAEFRNQGRLGCPNDYEVFAQPLAEILEKMHGGTEHSGKVPGHAGAGTDQQRDRMRLRRQLAEAVEREQYEEAARLRDLLREKESEGGPE